MNRAFSLVELSIVLVVLGLLTGGILAGQSLIRASELRSITTQIQQYQSSMYSFRDRYFGLPGDITNATSIWGKDAINCNWNSGTAATPGTCNGGGEGQIAAASEGFRFWQQLSLAGLIEGGYTGTGATTAAGTNVPASKFAKVGISAGYSSFYLKNFLWLGADSSSAYMTNSGFKPEDSWNIDTKLDDGKPATGLVWGEDGSDTTVPLDCKSGSSYNVSESSVACSMKVVILQ